MEDFPPVLARRLGWVAAGGVAACFTAGYALTRVPGISKVL